MNVFGSFLNAFAIAFSAAHINDTSAYSLSACRKRRP
jgi:hypothetical protein